VQYCLDFVIHFLYISLSASIYSKVSKTTSCLFVDIRVQTCVVKYYLEKKHCKKLCFYSGFVQWGQYDPMVLLTWLFSWYQNRVNLTFHSITLIIFVQTVYIPKFLKGLFAGLSPFCSEIDPLSLSMVFVVDSLVQGHIVIFQIVPEITVRVIPYNHIPLMYYWC
jgi:hypothetical protein